MKTKVAVVVMVFAVIFGAVAVPSSALAASIQSNVQAQATSFKNIPVTGTVANGGKLSGQLSIKSFNVVGGKLVANGTLDGKLTNAAGKTLGKFKGQQVSLPVQSINGVDPSTLAQASALKQANVAGPMSTRGDILVQACTILDLVLGPLDLDLLGLNVHLNQVHLTITANAGQGLLGDLLCAIDNLLNGGLTGILGQIADLLNQIIGILG